MTKAICDGRVEDNARVAHPARETVSKWSEHKDARLGAALAYYSVFSLGPLIRSQLRLPVSFSAPKRCKAKSSAL